MSHLHSDHAGHVNVFPDAEFVVQQSELRYCWWPDPVQEVFYLDGDFSVLRSADYDVTVVEGEYDVFGDGSVVTVPTPGHTPGHQSVQVELGAGTVLLGIDVAHQQDGLDREHTASFNHDLRRSLESMRELKARARAANAAIYVTHDNDHIEAFEGGMT
jgi:glyoxylase-like metal-dependent hydrolase (beta-lactamase superfamily II)